MRCCFYLDALRIVPGEIRTEDFFRIVFEHSFFCSIFERSENIGNYDFFYFLLFIFYYFLLLLYALNYELKSTISLVNYKFEINHLYIN